MEHNKLKFLEQKKRQKQAGTFDMEEQQRIMSVFEMLINDDSIPKQKFPFILAFWLKNLK